MLVLDLEELEMYDEETQAFIAFKKERLRLEHSLVSISKWESKYTTPFIGTTKTKEQSIDYIACMRIDRNLDPVVASRLSPSVISKVTEYINHPATATTFTEIPGKGSTREVITSELIYYWMITFGIPFECERWHLNRLLALIKVCTIKNSPAKKMSTSEALQQRTLLNQQRRKTLNTKG